MSWCHSRDLLWLCLHLFILNNPEIAAEVLLVSEQWPLLYRVSKILNHVLVGDSQLTCFSHTVVVMKLFVVRTYCSFSPQWVL